MLIIGAKGFTKEVLEVLRQRNELSGLVFYDDASADTPPLLYGQFPVLTTAAAARELFANDPYFLLGVGTPTLRRLLAAKMREMGGTLASLVSPKALVGGFGNTLVEGISLMSGAVLTNDIRVGEGVLINLNCHDRPRRSYRRLLRAFAGRSRIGQRHVGSQRGVGYRGGGAARRSHRSK